MSSSSNDNGRAFEYVFLISLFNTISKHRGAEIIENSSYAAAKRAWNSIDDEIKECLIRSATSCVSTLFDMEPLILETSGDKLSLHIQTDEHGEAGDVRDIIITRNSIQWEIGLSLKHNHFAVKHSRLSNRIDFGKQWFDYECSQIYWTEVHPVFDYLAREKRLSKAWSQLDNKEEDVYVPLLNAFVRELQRQCKQHADVPKRMVEYLLGKYDFYKVVSVDAKRLAEIQGYNFRGQLNKPGETTIPKIIVPQSALPSKILYIGFYKDRRNTIEICMDEGWHFTFRIHNAATKVETSLKFDVQIIGMPTTILTINCIWK